MGTMLTVSMVIVWWGGGPADLGKPMGKGVLLPQRPEFGLHGNSYGVLAAWRQSLEGGKELGCTGERGSLFPR